MPNPALIVSYSEISFSKMSIKHHEVQCSVYADRYETMLTFPEFVAKYNEFRPQEYLTFALNTGHIIILYHLIIMYLVMSQSASWRAKIIITVIHLLCEYRVQYHT